MEWNQKEFGERLKSLREGIGYTMQAFGHEIGTSASRIKNWEEGKSAPAASWIVKISDRFNVSIDDLLKGKITQAYATDAEDSVSPLFDMIAEEPCYYDAGHREEIEELVNRIHSLKHRKYAGPEGREAILSEITEKLTTLGEQDLLEIRTLVGMKKEKPDNYVIR